jgi:hypothetical protein
MPVITKSGKPSRAGRNMQAIARRNRRAVLKHALAAGMAGVQAKTIAAALGIGLGAIQGHLIALAKDGKIERTCERGMHVRWGPVGCYAPPTPSRRRKLAEQTEYMRQYSSRNAEDEQQAEAFCARPFVHRVLDASQAPAAVKAGPASVWDLAAGAQP